MATNQQSTFPAVPIVIPPGFKWAFGDIALQKDRNTFIRVGPIRHTRQGANVNAKPVRALSGAIKTSWNSQDPEEQHVIFNLEYRITGTPANISQALTYAGYGPDEIKNVINTSIARDNYANDQRYYNEINAHKALKAGRVQGAEYDIPALIWFATNIRSATYISSRTGDAGAARQAGAPPRGGGRTLIGAYKAVSQNNNGKVVDVSGIDDATGTSYKTIIRPKNGKFGVMTIPIVSRTLDKYIRALNIIFGAGAETRFAVEIEMVRQSIDAVPRPPPVGQQFAPQQGGFPGFPQQAAQQYAPQPGFPQAAAQQYAPQAAAQQYAPQAAAQQYAPQPGFPQPAAQQYAPQAPVEQYAPQAPVQQYAPQQADFLEAAPRPGAFLAPEPVLRQTGAPFAAVGSPPRTMGAPMGGMFPYSEVAQ